MKYPLIILCLLALPIVVTAEESSGALAKTGQTQCYDLYGSEISCEGTGQDGDHQSGRDSEGRFQDNGDGTVTDLFTNLIWTKKVNCVEFVNWQQALDYANSLESGMCGLTDGSTQGDWRLPNIRELDSLVGRKVTGSVSGLNFPDGHPFVVDSSSRYWSWS
ncbi:MAG: DUF1566 domain-containing protein, partial [Gammaproteobacteria bacterium]|nr:DUF1566 domain-containing protein [Gammaproteobacteria bacterium]